ncbi:MAG: DUF2905 domain-containing protein, partial [Candidatus Cloacimonetes bacterium]|nr:DUF2905 domain-containing protein [Candidatus Cloacimonadota bacterium]
MTGKFFILLGVILIILGIVMLIPGVGSWLGNLPGDIRIRRGNFSWHFPLATCLIISLIL